MAILTQKWMLNIALKSKGTMVAAHDSWAQISCFYASTNNPPAGRFILRIIKKYVLRLGQGMPSSKSFGWHR
jgi:hypothetical protein